MTVYPVSQVPVKLLLASLLSTADVTRKTIHEFFTKHIGWAALKDELADMYMRRFTEKELTEINAFYITPAGQKVITVLPELAQERNQLAMMRLQQNIGELQQIVGTQKPKP